MIDSVDRVLGGKFPETMCCRYNPGGIFAMSNGIMDNPGDSKYGMTKEQLFEAYRILQSKGVRHFGLHAFLASNTVTNEYYPKLAGQLFELAVELKQATGADITMINLSGGVGIPYRPDQEPNDIRAIGEGVRRKFEEILVPAGLGGVRIFTEMGRFMMGPYGALITKAIHEKHIYKEYIGVDACACNLMRPAMYGAYHHITVLGKENAPCDHKYDITGSSARTTISLPLTAACQRLRWEIICLSMTPARMGSPWAITTMASCGVPSCCSMRTARYRKSADLRRREIILPLSIRRRITERFNSTKQGAE